jgi:putative transposase
MQSVFSALLTYIVSHLRSHQSLRLENMALRHQLAVYQHTVKRPKLRPADRLFWSWLSRLWSDWQEALAFVQPRTVIAWQKRRFRDYGGQRSQSGRPGRPALSKDVRDLIRDMWCFNPLWGRLAWWVSCVSWASTWPNPRWRSTGRASASRLHPRGRPFSSITSKTSWRVISSPFQLPASRSCWCLSCWLTSADVSCSSTSPHTRRRSGPPSKSLRPWETAPRSLLRDRDAIYSVAFQHRVQHMGLEEVKIAPRSPWHNPSCERLIGSMRRDGLDHVIVLNDRPLKRLLRAYIAYYHRFRTHLSLAMDCPHPRAVQPPETGRVIALPDVGGLHQHDERQAA